MLPVIIGAVALCSGIIGVGGVVKGGVDMLDAKDKCERANVRNKENQARYKRMRDSALAATDVLGNNEMKILKDFRQFCQLYERIKNVPPEFENKRIDGISIPPLEFEQLKKTSIGAGVLIGGLGGAALGTAGGFAASGAATAAVMAIGSASTGTAISSLTGVAATNATLAALGGGSLAAGGGGMALGTTILGASTLGIGLLVGGVIFGLAGSKCSSKSDQIWHDMLSAEKTINKICKYLFSLQEMAKKYNSILLKISVLYEKQFFKMEYIIDSYNKEHVDWNEFSSQEKLLIENTVRVVSLLYHMCKVPLVLKKENSDQNILNKDQIEKSIEEANLYISVTN